MSFAVGVLKSTWCTISDFSGFDLSIELALFTKRDLGLGAFTEWGQCLNPNHCIGGFKFEHGTMV